MSKKFENGISFENVHNVYVFATAEKFENTTITGHFRSVFVEGLGREIT